MKGKIDIVWIMLFFTFIIMFHFEKEKCIEEYITYRTEELYNNEVSQRLKERLIQNLELNKIIDDCRKCTKKKTDLIYSGDFPCELH